jgi:hypothetical protein
MTFELARRTRTARLMVPVCSESDFVDVTEHLLWPRESLRQVLAAASGQDWTDTWAHPVACAPSVTAAVMTFVPARSGTVA